uniref:Uncharacterized protein n=1 Tax=Lepeophtheirus salmonis TaxID=72036 RepID=A0A0K2UGM3_LEPSM
MHGRHCRSSSLRTQSARQWSSGTIPRGGALLFQSSSCTVCSWWQLGKCLS